MLWTLLLSYPVCQPSQMLQPGPWHQPWVPCLGSAQGPVGTGCSVFQGSEDVLNVNQWDPQEAMEMLRKERGSRERYTHTEKKTSINKPVMAQLGTLQTSVISGPTGKLSSSPRSVCGVSLLKKRLKINVYVNIFKLKIFIRKSGQSGWVAQMAGTLSPIPKSCRFKSQARHIPRWQV